MCMDCICTGEYMFMYLAVCIYMHIISIYVGVLSVYILMLVYWFIRRQANLRKYIPHVYNWFERKLTFKYILDYLYPVSVKKLFFVFQENNLGIKRNRLWTIFQEFRHLPSLVINYDWYVFWSESVSRSVVSLCSSINCTLSGSYVHGILQARTLEWTAVPFFRGSARPKDQSWIFSAPCCFKWMVIWMKGH